MRPRHGALLCWLATAAACGGRGLSDEGIDEGIQAALAGRDPEVVRAVDEALARVRASPGDGGARRALAQVLDANEVDAAAEAAWLRVTELDPRDAHAWYHLARVAERRGEPARALEALSRALALDDGYAPLHARAGRLLLESGELDEASAALTRALALDPALPAAALGLARLELLRDRPAGAIAVLEPLAARAPREPYVNGLLARAFAMQGESARAARHLRAEEEAGPPGGRDPWLAEVQRHACGLRVRLERAKALLAEGDPQAAWHELEPLAARAGELAVLDTQCQVLLALGRPEEVLARIERADSALRTGSLLAIKRVLALRALGERERALAELEAELRRNPAHPSAQVLRGELLFELERHAEAVEAFERARLAGELALANLLQLGRARAASGDLEGGLRELAAAAEEFPAAPKPWAYRCELLALEGRAAEARASLEEAKKRGLEAELVARVAARLDELTGGEGE